MSPQHDSLTTQVKAAVPCATAQHASATNTNVLNVMVPPSRYCSANVVARGRVIQSVGQQKEVDITGRLVCWVKAADLTLY